MVTISRAVKSEGGKSLKHLNRPLLTAVMVHKRHKRCSRLLNDMKCHGNRVLIFSDEKTFTVDPVVGP